MLVYLQLVFGNLNRRENTENDFRALRQENQDFATFWTEFQRLSIELNWNNAILINNLTSKLSIKMRRQLSIGDKRPTNLFKYAKRCQRVYQDLKNIARAKAASDQYTEKRAAAAATSSHTSPTKKVATTNTTTTQTMSFLDCQLTFSERDQLMKEEKCFTCKEVRHQTINCSKEWKPMSSLAVSRMAVQEVQKLESQSENA